MLHFGLKHVKKLYSCIRSCGISQALMYSRLRMSESFVKNSSYLKNLNDERRSAYEVEKLSPKID